MTEAAARELVMSLPPFAPLPPANIRLSIAPAEWEACLDAWITLADAYVRIPSEALQRSLKDDDSLVNFFHSFYSELANVDPTDASLSNPQGRRLQRSCFSIVGRLIIDDLLPNSMLTWDFLADFTYAHVRSSALPRLMDSLWKRKASVLEGVLQKHKTVLISRLESQATTLPTDLKRLAPFVRASPEAGVFFMTGSDFLDALALAYSKSDGAGMKHAVISVAYLGLTSLVAGEQPHTSALTDCLYSLKTQADQQKEKSTLLHDLVTNTVIIAKLRRTASGKGAERLNKLLDALETYRTPSISRPRKHVKRTVSKGQGKGRQTNGDLHIHRMSLVTQVQDLFPDLGAGFVLKLLDEYDDNVEQVTAHLLDETLPPYFSELDRSEDAPIYDSSPGQIADHLAPRSTPPPPEPFVPDRRNVFDDDDLLMADASRLHLGKAERTASGLANKSAILSALAAFDADDDERDDTYDVDDVGGTVDTAHPDGEPAPVAKVTLEENDAALFTAYKSGPEVFGRTFDVRRGQARQALKKETGMTDEAIEGWAIMLQREPRRLKRLEERFSGAGAFDGRQTEIGRTAYRESPGGTKTEDSDAPGGDGDRGRGGFRGRGRGGRGRGRGRGGNAAGPSSDPSTANAQRRKEANKGSRANHNRRDQRARRMARGGFPG